MIPRKKEESEYIKWFSEIHKGDISDVGGKGANLGEMYNIGMPVPPGFVITSEAYSYFIAGIAEKIDELINNIDVNDTKQLDNNAKKIREMIIAEEIPQKMKEEIFEAYDNLNINQQVVGATKNVMDILKFSDPVFVAVRSSATAEDLADASFAGQQETFLNIKGRSNLLEAIKKCFASLFTARAIYYRAKKGFKNALIAVVVQQMVNSDKSGVMFSRSPVGDEEEIMIEAVYGLGEGIVSGRIKPDQYIVSREMEIKRLNLSNKKIALVRSSSGETRQIELEEEKAKSQVLNNYEIKKLAQYGLELEKHYNKAQDIEFAVDSGRIYIVQTRAITTLGKKKEQKEISGNNILEGLGASPGIGEGKVKIVREMVDLEKVQKGDVLVTKMTNPDMVVSMQRASGIITDEGGITSHAAIVSREMGIPCIVGTERATKILRDDDEVIVDGTHGKVYKGKLEEQKEEIKEILEKSEKKEILPIVETKTKIKVMVDLPDFAERASKTGIKSVGLVRLEGIIAEFGKHPYYFKGKEKSYEDVIFKGLYKIAEFFEELWIRTSDIRSDEYSNLEGAPKKDEDNPMLGMHGIRDSLKNPELLKAELRAASRIENKKIGIMMPQVISPDEIRQVKDLLKEEKIDNLILGVMIETPAAVQVIEEICQEGVEFISFGTNDLTQYTLAIDRNNEKVSSLYNEMHPAVLKQLEYVINICKKFNVESSICGQAGSRKEMVEFLVEKGIDSISVNADAAHDISKFVRALELKTEVGISKFKDEEEQKDSREEFPHFEVNFDVFSSEKNERIKEEVNHQIEEEIKMGMDLINPINQVSSSQLGTTELQEEPILEESEFEGDTELDIF